MYDTDTIQQIIGFGIGAVNADLQESISAVREVQAFSREAENIEQCRASNAANRDANVQAQAFTSALGPALEALSYVSLAIVAGVGGFYLLGDGQLLGTTFVIAHRLSTVRRADQLLVLQEGQIVARGTHETLLAARGFYYELYMSQFQGEGEDAGILAGAPQA